MTDSLVRLALIAALAAGTFGVVAVWRRRSSADAALGPVDAAGESWPAVPGEFRPGAADRTWLIFTTPVCATCAQVQAELTRTFPADRVVKVDATEHIDLADRYAVRRAPTTLLAGADGSVIDRLVGPEAVHRYITERVAQ
jgi:hypothetical protein